VLNKSKGLGNKIRIFPPKGGILMREQIVKQVIEQYLNSSDFNGLPYKILRDRLSIEEDRLINLLIELLENDQIEIVYGDYHPNPHIKAFSGIDKCQQISKMGNHELLNNSCIYPHNNVLKGNSQIDRDYIDKPYSKELAQGAGQIDFRAFDLSVLEIYRNDPRYHYDNNDISGCISLTGEYYQSDKISESDKVLLQSFGFCYNEDLDRAVAVFLRYLAKLTPEHQQIWKAKELSGEFKLHPDYYRNSILGEWGTRLPIFDAFIMELDIVNIMCSRMGRPPLFKATFKNSRPREFGFLLRPTLREFNSFVHLLDKMMSDNLNKDFFRGDIVFEKETERYNGKIQVTQKGTIHLLEDWIGKYFRPQEPDDLNEMFLAFKQVRKLRQNPAHSINENEFDQKYFKEQRELIKIAYNAIRTIRLILANHPAVKANPPDINNLLYDGKIWDI
jgi:hypothetical protein